MYQFVDIWFVRNDRKKENSFFFVFEFSYIVFPFHAKCVCVMCVCVLPFNYIWFGIILLYIYARIHHTFGWCWTMCTLYTAAHTVHKILELTFIPVCFHAGHDSRFRYRWNNGMVKNRAGMVDILHLPMEINANKAPSITSNLFRWKKWNWTHKFI